jgi:hypothetical protein
MTDIKPPLAPFHYPQRARNLGPRQAPPATEKAQKPRVLPAAAVMPAAPEKPATGRASKPTGALRNLHDDRRPPFERTASGRYLQPGLFENQAAQTSESRL